MVRKYSSTFHPISIDVHIHPHTHSLTLIQNAHRSHHPIKIQTGKLHACGVFTNKICTVCFAMFSRSVCPSSSVCSLSLFLSLFIFYERRETIKYSWEKLHYVFWYGCHLKANKKIEHSYNNSIKKRIQQNRTETFYVIKTKIEQSFLHACVYVSLCLSHRVLSHETWKKKQHEKKEAPRK